MRAEQQSEALLPPAAADCSSGVRLMKSEDRNTENIINRPGRSTYPEEKSVLTSGATSAGSRLWLDVRGPTTSDPRAHQHDRYALAARVTGSRERVEGISAERRLSVAGIPHREVHMFRKISSILACVLAFAGAVAASDEPTAPRTAKTFTLFQHETAAPEGLSPQSRQELEASTEGQDLVNVRWFKSSAIDPTEFAVGDRLVIQVGPHESFELEIARVEESPTTGTRWVAGGPPGVRSFSLFAEFASIAAVTPDQTFRGGSLRALGQGGRVFTMNTVPEAPGFVHVREIVKWKPADLSGDVVAPPKDDLPERQ